MGKGRGRRHRIGAAIAALTRWAAGLRARLADRRARRRLIRELEAIFGTR